MGKTNLHSYQKLVLGTLFVMMLAPGGFAQSLDYPQRHAPARHLAERPPLTFEVDNDVAHPRVLITNLHSEPLTACLYETASPSGGENAKTVTYDVLISLGLLSAIPRGLTLVSQLRSAEGQPVPDARLVAAVWQDGTSYGSVEALSHIQINRQSALAAYEGIIAILQEGESKHWRRGQYSSELKELEKKLGTEKAKDRPEAAMAATLPIQIVYASLMRPGKSGSGRGAAAASPSQAELNRQVQHLSQMCATQRDLLKQTLEQMAAALAKKP